MNSFALFGSIFALIFLAELPDKTVFATLLLATRHHPLAVFSGVSMAFLVQNLVALALGSVMDFLPHRWVQLGSAILFLIFAVASWMRKSENEEEGKEISGNVSFWKSAWLSFLMIFIAEWGDLTQLATVTLIAKYPTARLLVFSASTLALWSATGVFIAIGYFSKQFIRTEVLKKIAAVGFALAGAFLLVRALHEF